MNSSRTPIRKPLVARPRSGPVVKYKSMRYFELCSWLHKTILPLFIRILRYLYNETTSFATMLYKTNNIAAAAVLLGAVPALAQTTISGDFDFSNSDCPGNQLLTQQDGKQYCCPGTVFGEDEEQFCCVGATVSVPRPAHYCILRTFNSLTIKSQFEVETPSFASCFPTCTGGDGVSNIATSTQSCSTSIFFTNSDYSSLAQAAAASLSGSNSGSGSGSVTTTSSGSQSVSTTSGTHSSGASSDSTSTGSATQASATTADSESAISTSDESTGGAAIITSGPMLGGLMAAGVLMMAL